jgi:hypothetical protein
MTAKLSARSPFLTRPKMPGNAQKSSIYALLNKDIKARGAMLPLLSYALAQMKASCHYYSVGLRLVLHVQRYY